MYTDSSYLITNADTELRNPDTTAARVQELFQEWWDKRNGHNTLDNDIYILSVKIVDMVGIAGTPVPRFGLLHFPMSKLTPEQIKLLEDNMNNQENTMNNPENNTNTNDNNTQENGERADEYILWAAGRAAAIAAVPLPLADVGPLMANEAYMIYRLASVYDCTIDQSVVTMLAGVAGGSIFGKLLSTFLPFLKVPIAAGITYAVGKAAKAYFASGMTLSSEDLLDIFTHARQEADHIDWEKHKVEESTPEERP